MKSRVNSLTIIIFICSLFMTGCAYLEVGSLKNKPEKATASPPDNISVQQDSRIINKDGWQFPSTQNLDMGEPAHIEMKSVDGKSFQVKRTFFNPYAETFFTVDGFAENLTRIYGKLRLYRINEFNLNGKIFMYEIAVMRVGENTNKNSTTAGTINGYQLLDTDGDGKFETYIDDTNIRSAEILIPEWATK